MSLLLGHGADVATVDGWGDTPLDNAVARGNAVIASQLCAGPGAGALRRHILEDRG